MKMKICVAQTKSIKGDIQANIENHKRFIDLAVSDEADIIIFPELSLTGYEPTLAKKLATTFNDSRLDDFQVISNTQQITIGVGLPTRNNAGICISMVLFHPDQAREIYSKQYLHADEEPFFVSGQSCSGLIGEASDIALAICYEISVPQHAEAACKNGASIYLASVAKFTNGIDKAFHRLSEIAKQNSMIVMMSNCIGEADGGMCAGQSAIWNKEGSLLGQLEEDREGIIIFDTEQKILMKKMLG